MATKTKPAVKIRPLGDKVLLVRDAAQERTDSGLYLPENAKDAPKTGKIVAVGDGALNTETGERIALTLKKGDRVIFSSYAGTEVKLDTEEYLMLGESEILAVFDA